MPPHGQAKLSGIPRRRLATAPTPAPMRTTETPIGKIQPVFDDFSFAETSDWLEDPTPAPASRLYPPSSITLGRSVSSTSFKRVLPPVPAGDELDGHILYEESELHDRGGRDSTVTSAHAGPSTTRRSITPAYDISDRSMAIAATGNTLTPHASYDDLFARKVFDAGRTTTPVVAPAPVPIPQPPVSHYHPGDQTRPYIPVDRSVTPIARVVPAAVAPAPERQMTPEQEFQPPPLPSSVSTRSRRRTRTIVAVGAGGKQLTRAERAAAAAAADGRAILPPPKKSLLQRIPVAEREIPPAALTSKQSPPCPAEPAQVAPKRKVIHSPRPSPPKRAEPSISTHELSERDAYPHEQTIQYPIPERLTSTRTYASPALSHTTEEGRREDWDVSAERLRPLEVATPGDRENKEEVRERSETPIVAMPEPERVSTPVAADVSTVSADTSRRSSGLLGLLSSLLRTVSRESMAKDARPSTPVSEAVRAATPPMAMKQVSDRSVTRSSPARVFIEEDEQAPRVSLPTAPPVERAARPAPAPARVRSSAQPNHLKRARPDVRPDAQPLVRRTVSGTSARILGPKRPAEPTHTTRRRHESDRPVTSARSAPRATAPVRRPLGAVRPPNVPSAVAAPPAKRQKLPPLPRSNAAPPALEASRQAQVSAFAAAAIARLPKVGTATSAASCPVKVRDAERARDMALKRAMFDRLAQEGSELAIPLPTPPITHHRRETVMPIRGQTPGRASRQRAQERAKFDARVAAAQAEKDRAAAELARVRAEVEAEFEREERQRRIVRANPLPAMYGRRQVQ